MYSDFVPRSQANAPLAIARCGSFPATSRLSRRVAEAAGPHKVVSVLHDVIDDLVHFLLEGV